jgi:hypothetical protein
MVASSLGASSFRRVPSAVIMEPVRGKLGSPLFWILAAIWAFWTVMGDGPGYVKPGVISHLSMQLKRSTARIELMKYYF